MSSQRNVAASVRQRLLNCARSEGRPFNELLQYYAMERFLHRLTKSVHADKFVLKGALMLRAWGAPEFRPTMDIDMLGRTSSDVDQCIGMVQDLIAIEVEPDGLVFVVDNIQAERITEDANYKGIRIKFLCFLGTAKVCMQVDIGFGDIVYPATEKISLPTMLDFPESSLLCYSRESAIAEKFQAMVKLGIQNSRMRDFYDIWLLSRYFDFSGANLMEAIRLTFKKRGTQIDEEIEAFSEEFAHRKQVQWAAFHKRLKQTHVPVDFCEITLAVKAFLNPMVKVLATKEFIPVMWAKGCWC